MSLSSRSSKAVSPACRCGCGPWRDQQASMTSQVSLPRTTDGQNVVAEHLIDRDHVRVGLGIPRVDRQQLRFLFGKPVQHRDLEDKSKAVPAVGAQRGGIDRKSVV